MSTPRAPTGLGGRDGGTGTGCKEASRVEAGGAGESLWVDAILKSPWLPRLSPSSYE